ncbi:lipoyl synthase [bacterium]|nr:lipoyl synthase [bacterium]
MNRDKLHTPGDNPRRLPPWMRRKVRLSENVTKLKKIIKDKNLHTVCQSAGCPNFHDCFEKPTATFMILGNICSRNCRFCGVPKGTPALPDNDEPDRVADAAESLQLKHIVITSVTRDDLEDGGAAQFARTIEAIRHRRPETTTEVLIPDFQGNKKSLQTVLNSGIDILNHNVETVPRLYPDVRPQADFEQSLCVLRNAKELKTGIITKSGLMVGLGETVEEMMAVFRHLTEVGCDALTIGQYLAPNHSSFPLVEYIHPDQFERYRQQAESAGIRYVYAGPYVRSSYNAEELMDAVKEARSE